MSQVLSRMTHYSWENIRKEFERYGTHELEVERADTSRCHDSDSQTWPTFSRWQRCCRGGRRSFRSRAAESASTSKLPD